MVVGRCEGVTVIDFQRTSSSKILNLIRIHRAFVVAVDAIESWSPAEVELDGFMLPIGRTYKNQVLKQLQEHFDTNHFRYNF